MGSRAHSAAVAMRVASQTREKVLSASIRAAGALDGDLLQLLKDADAAFAEGHFSQATARFSEALVQVEELLSVPTIPIKKRADASVLFAGLASGCACCGSAQPKDRTWVSCAVCRTKYCSAFCRSAALLGCLATR